jgi:hypothetical protein
MTSDTVVRGFIERLDAVERRLAAHAELDPPAGLTEPDLPSGERWEAGQVWAHMAEFVPYWMSQLRSILEQYDGEPVPFGRVKTDPLRIAAIERDRRTAPASLHARTQRGMEDLRGWLPSLDEGAWAARGVNPRMRELTIEQIVDDVLVGHLEEHADQLDGLRAGSG